MDFDEYYHKFWQYREAELKSPRSVCFYKVITRRIYDRFGGSEAPLQVLERSSTIEEFLEEVGKK